MNLGNVVIEPELNSNRELKDSIKTEILSHYERPTQDFTLFIYRPQGRPADGLEEAMGKHMKNWCEDSVILIIDYDGHVDTTGLGLSSELKGLITETFVMKSSHGAVDKGDSTTEKALERIDRILTTKFGMKRKIDRQDPLASKSRTGKESDQLIGRNHEDRISIFTWMFQTAKKALCAILKERRWWVFVSGIVLIVCVWKRPDWVSRFIGYPF